MNKCCEQEENLLLIGVNGGVEVWECQLCGHVQQTMATDSMIVKIDEEVKTWP